MANFTTQTVGSVIDYLSENFDRQLPIRAVVDDVDEQYWPEVVDFKVYLTDDGFVIIHPIRKDTSEKEFIREKVKYAVFTNTPIEREKDRQRRFELADRVKAK